MILRICLPACPPAYLSPAATQSVCSSAAPILAGAADGTLQVWDRRKASSPVFSFHHHSQAVTVVEWCPQQAGVFSSAGEDRCGPGCGGVRGERACRAGALSRACKLQAAGILLLSIVPRLMLPPAAAHPLPLACCASHPTLPQAAVRLGPRRQSPGR